MNRIPSSDVDRLGVVFDDGSLVADAGLLVAGTLMARLGLEQLLDETVRLGDRPGGAYPGRKVLSLVASMLVGGSHIDHADRLRAGSTDRVLPFRVMAPSTLGTFLRSFTWGHVRQIDKALSETLKRVWSAGGGPDREPVTVDVDSTICEVSANTKHGASYGYTGMLGYHPLVAVRSETAGDRSFPPAEWFLTERRRPFRGGDGEPGQTGRRFGSGDGTGRFWVLVLPSDS